MEQNAKRPRIKSNRISVERIQKFISPVYFSDVNLTSRLYEHVHQVEEIRHYAAEGRIPFDEAVPERLYSKTQLNTSFGPTWSTHWFLLKIDLSVKKEWKNKEVRLRWNSGSEAMVWISEKPMQGLTGGDSDLRTDYILTNSCEGTERISVYIEMAANGLFGAGENGMINPPDLSRTFMLSMCELAVRNDDVYYVMNSLKNIISMAKTLSDDSTIYHEALTVGCDVVNCCQPFNEQSLERAKSLLDTFFGDVGDNERAHYNVHAIGHCHIDTAWLWPYDETKRKCARSWSSVIELMKRYPDFKFACSQAVQLNWVKENYPKLFDEIKLFSKSKRFIPVGGTWVEMDGNIPSGEAFVRQFLYGQRFFKEHFGEYCDVFWLPDTFGYSAQLPQIIKKSGIKYFLTQKISWSLINKFPHSSFVWQGIDGSRCLTHFPPADSYSSDVSFEDVMKTEKQNRDRGYVRDGMLLYGYGDGGGGPTETMLDNLKQFGNIPGLPSMKHSSPSDFFQELEISSSKLHTWVGELYLELHQGTFTTHAKVKKQNRRCEVLLKNLEFFECLDFLMSVSRSSERYIDEVVFWSKQVNTTKLSQSLWKKILLNQFHDVLPGTSINQVYVDAHEIYDDVIDAANTRIDEIIQKINLAEEEKERDLSLYNTTSWFRDETIEIPYDDEHACSCQMLPNGNMLACVSAEPFGCTWIGNGMLGYELAEVSIVRRAYGIFMENESLAVTINNNGQILSLTHKDKNMNVIDEGRPANVFDICTDIPLYWDAWDVMPYNEETRFSDFKNSGVEIYQDGPIRVSVKFSLQLSEKSKLTQIISLDSRADFLRFNTEVSWHENRKILKVSFPFNINTTKATYDIQFGHLDRPTHGNTSWDWAKHEVCGHKWVDISEYDFGVALINDCKYGFSCHGSTLEMSLLRSSKAPDSEADMGSHIFSYALMPHKGSFQESRVIERAHEFNNPIIAKKGVFDASIFTVDVRNVILETMKLVEEGQGVILRLFECHGSRGKFVLKSHYPFKNVYRVNLLEEKKEDEEEEEVRSNTEQCTIECFIKPFEIVSLRVEF